MGWFQKKSVDAPAARPLQPAWLSAGGEAGFARSYDAQLSQIVRDNPVGARALRLVAGAVGDLCVYALDGSEGSEQAARLVARDDLMERAAAALLAHGNAYVQLLLDGEGNPAELALLRPERVRLAVDPRGQPSAYLYKVGAHTSRIAARDPLARRRIAHVRDLNLADDHYGQGCLSAAIAAASLHNRASRWNKALLDNAARPSGALVHSARDGSVLSPTQFDRLRRELAEQFSGSDQAGRPLLLDGGLSWQALSLSPADMDFVALKEAAAREIALAFGVPPVLVGLPGDATYANAREAGRALYRQTVLPLAGRLLRGIEAMLGDWLGPVRLGIDTDQLSELAEDRARLWEQVRGADFLSREEKRELLGFAREETRA